MHARHGRVLGELAEAGMVMVRELSGAMARTEDLQTRVQLALAFHRVSRAVRLTMALEFRLAQEARRPLTAHAAAPPSPEPRSAAPPRPDRPERLDCYEYERDDSREPDELDALLEAEDLDVATVQEAVEASLAEILRDLAADPLLVKAGVLDATIALPTPAPRNRRSELLGAGAFVRPDLLRRGLLPPPRSGGRGTAPRRGRGGGGEPQAP